MEEVLDLTTFQETEKGNQVIGQEWQNGWGQSPQFNLNCRPGWDPKLSLRILMVKHHSWKIWIQSFCNSIPKCSTADTAANLVLNGQDCKSAQSLQISYLRMIWNISRYCQNWKPGKSSGKDELELPISRIVSTKLRPPCQVGPKLLMVSAVGRGGLSELNKEDPLFASELLSRQQVPWKHVAI